MELTEAKHCDHAAVIELANLAYRGRPHGAIAEDGWTSERGLIEGPRITAASLSESLRREPKAHLLVYRDVADGPVLGTVWLEPKDEVTWNLKLLTIRPDLQNRQLGRALLAAAEAFAERRNAKYVRLTVLNRRTALLAWYERRGYIRTGEIEPFPYADERFGKALVDGLAFVVLDKELPAGVRVT